MSTLQIMEGVEGIWSYHLAEVGKYRPLCNATRARHEPTRMVMHTSLHLLDWGCVCGNEGIKYRWCVECKALADAL